MTEETKDLIQEGGAGRELDRIPVEQASENQTGIGPRWQEGQAHWSQPMHMIAVGFILSGITLEFLWLDVILPLVGTVLLYLGCRQLHLEGPYFRRAWMVGLIRLALTLVNAFLLPAPIGTVGEGAMRGFLLVCSVLLILLGLSLQLIFLWSMHKGVLEVYDRVMQKPPRVPFQHSIIFIAVLFAGIFLLPLLFLLGIVAIIGLLIWGLWILYSMYRLGTEMDDLPFGYTPAPVRVKTPMVVVGFFAAYLVLLLPMCILSNHLRLEAQPYEAPPLSAQRQNLVQMGIPETIVLDLSDEHVALLQEAEGLQMNREELLFVDGALELASTFLVMEVPGERITGSEIYGLLYFTMDEGGNVWQNGLQLQVKREGSLEDAQGVLLYEKQGQGYRAAFPRFAYTGAGGMGVPWGNHLQFMSGYTWEPFSQEIRGAFNFPFGSSRQRGYVLFQYRSVLPGEKPEYVSLQANYALQDSFWNLPYEAAEDRAAQGYQVLIHFMDYEYLGNPGRNQE